MADAPLLSRAFLDRAERLQSSPDADTATAQTVRRMCQMIATAARDPLVIATARDAASRYRGGPFYKGGAGADVALARSAWWFTKHALSFIHHEEQIRMLFNESDQLQLLISPDVVLRMNPPAGDCAIYTMLVCALLKVSGVPFEIVTAAVDSRQPAMFTHVYARAVIAASGTRLPLDASHGSYPGWEVPRAHMARKQVWDESGNAIADAQPWPGLHGYQRRGLGQSGVDPSSGEAWGSAGGGGSAWAGFFQDLAKQWSVIGGRVIAPTTQSSTFNPRTGMYQNIETPGVSNTLMSPLLSATSDTSWLVWAGVGAGVLLLFSLAKGKR